MGKALRFLFGGLFAFFMHRDTGKEGSSTAARGDIPEQGVQLYKEGEELKRNGDWQYAFCKYLDCYELWAAKDRFLLTGGNLFTFDICQEIGKLLLEHGNRDRGLHWLLLNLKCHEEFHRQRFISDHILYCAFTSLLHPLLDNFQETDRPLLEQTFWRYETYLIGRAQNSSYSYNANLLARSYAALGDNDTAHTWFSVVEERKRKNGF